MKTLRLLCLLAAFIPLAGCPGDPCFTDSIGIPEPQHQLALVGRQVELTLFPFVPGNCDGSDIPGSPTSLVAEVSDPDYLSVPVQTSLRAPSSASLRFTPQQPGRYHIFAAFSPVGGIHQFELYAVNDRSADVPLEFLSLPCTTLDRTLHGAWLCDDALFRDTSPLQSFPGARVAIADNVVWVVDSTRAQRFVDTGTELQLTASVTHAQGAAEALLATPEELVVLHSRALVRFTFDESSLIASAPTPWAGSAVSFHPQGPTGLLLRSGERLALVTRSTEFFDSFLQVCAYRLDAGRFVRTSDPCQTHSGLVIGFEAQGLWVGDARFSPNDFTSLRWLEWTPAGLVEQASLPLSFNLRILDTKSFHRGSVVPVLIPSFLPPTSSPIFALATYSPERHAILLEHLDSEIALPLASSSLLWGPRLPSDPSSGLRIRVRSPSP